MSGNSASPPPRRTFGDDDRVPEPLVVSLPFVVLDVVPDHKAEVSFAWQYTPAQALRLDREHEPSSTSRRDARPQPRRRTGTGDRSRSRRSLAPRRPAFGTRGHSLAPRGPRLMGGARRSTQLCDSDQPIPRGSPSVSCLAVLQSPRDSEIKKPSELFPHLGEKGGAKALRGASGSARCRWLAPDRA